MSTGLLVLYFSRLFWTGCTPSYFPACLVGRRLMGTSAWIWGAWIRKLDAGAVMGKFHISACLCGGVEPIQRQYYPGGYILGKNAWCCWSRYIRCVSAWGFACSGRGFCKLSAKWVPCEALGIPYFWSRAIEALPPANCCIRVWVPGPIFHDRVCGKSSEGCRDSVLDGISSCIAQGDHHEQSLYTGPCWFGGKHCRCMATGSVVLGRDWPQRWWR